MLEEKLLLAGRLAAEQRQMRWMRVSFVVVGLVAAASLLWAGFRWSEGWEMRDYLYLFSGAVWLGFLVVQARIYRQRRIRADRLTRRLQGGH